MRYEAGDRNEQQTVYFEVTILLNKPGSSISSYLTYMLY